jgi:capsid protein
MDTNFKWYNPVSWFSNQTEEPKTEKKLDPTAYYGLTYTNVQTVSFNGEKNPGAAGPMVDYRPDYAGLRVRSWQSVFESDLAQIGINKLITWVIGKGLKIQSEPEVTVLEDEGIKLDKAKFVKSFEHRFNLWKRRKSCDYSNQNNLNDLCREAERNAIIGGDVLVVLRVVKGDLKIQLIDGENVQSPYYGTQDWPQNLPNGHTIIDGVEINDKREQVAYYVKVYAVDASFENLYKYKFERIPAIGAKTGTKMAYLYYGFKNRINNVRGIPLLSACFEKLNNIDLYSGATLKQAQEAAKVDYQVVHNKEAAGQAPWVNATVSAANGMGPLNNDQLPVTNDGEEVGKTVHVTGLGTAINNNPGSRIEMLENKNTLYFKDFYETHADTFFATLMLPPDVAMGKYNNSFSASRAAIMDWAHVLSVKREHHYEGFLEPIVSLWLELQILTNKIQAPGYVVARSQGNRIITECYKVVRFTGANVPHIDPLKEVKAAREKLGKAFDYVPLDDLENVTESLGGGDSNENIEQASEELKKAEGLGLKAPPEPQPINQPIEKTKPVKKKKPI